MIAASSVVIGVVNNILSNRRAEKSKQIDLFNRFYLVRSNEAWWSNLNEFLYIHSWEDSEEWLEKYHPAKNIEAYNSFTNLMSYFNSIGYLVKIGELDISNVADVMGTPIIPVWEKAKPLVYEWRKSWSTIYRNFEYLYDETVKWREANMPSFYRTT